MDDDLVVLVDSRDEVIGQAPKLLAHREGRLHRAVSVFIFNPAGELLLQRRAEGKYHSPGLWSNACCTHPRPGEEPRDAATRRLSEEMGLESSLRRVFSFLYRAEVGPDLTEHELDHVFVGGAEGDPHPDPEEVQEWRWVGAEDLRREVARSPHRFTAWLPLMLEEAIQRWREMGEAAPEQPPPPTRG